MTRVVRLCLLLGCSCVLGTPTESQAGVIPWMYDAIFGPVGSVRAQYPMAAGPYAAGYAPYSARYAPYSVGYAPYYESYGSYSASYAPFYSSYTADYAPVSTLQYSSFGSGCSTCNQASYSPSSECSSCGSGNCASGNCATGNCSSGNCSNCSVNSAGYSSGVSGPTPDPNYSRSKDDEIRQLQQKLDELEHREKQTEKFLKNQYPEFRQEQFRTYRDDGEVVPQRRKDSFGSGSDPNKETFERPNINSQPAPSRTPDEEEEEARKAIIPPGKNEGAGEKTDNSTKPKEAVPATFRIDNRVTSRAVAPRERMQSSTQIAGKPEIQPVKQAVSTPQKAPITKVSKRILKSTETSQAADRVRN